MTLNQDFVSKVCDAFRRAVESASEFTLEGREREFRQVLARHLLGEALGWEDHYKIGEIYDITCFDEENFPIILIETKWVETTESMESVRKLINKTKRRLKERIEELGSVKYGVFASNRDFIVYEYVDFKLEEITKVNVAEAVGVARGAYGLSEEGMKRILKLELLKRERLVWVEEPEYFERTYKEVSVEKGEGVKLLTENLKEIVKDLTTVFMKFFHSYMKRKQHYSGRFLENTFNDWLKISIKEEEFKKGDQSKRKEIIETFCRETAYVLLGRILFTRICEDKGVIESTISGGGMAESLRFYSKRGIENVYLYLFNESRQEIKKYYSHLHELGFFDWWLIEEVKKGTLSYEEGKIQASLENDLNYALRKAFMRLNRFDFEHINRDILGDVYQGYLPPDERKKLGEFYTPKKVIEYILDACGYKPENEIQGKKLLDPACGSGGFLVEATRRLIERYRRIGLDIRNPDDARQIIEECISRIYGLDIHPFACFIAEMNMLFQLIDLYDTAREKYRHYKIPRLNIYRTDSLIPPGETPIELSGFMENSRRKMLIEETRGADRIKRMKFDFVVGNPPYVRVDNLPQSYRDKYSEIFKDLLVGKWDVYIPFIFKGIEWLDEHGERKFGFIVSNKFFLLEHGLPLRRYLLKNCSIEQIIDLSGIKVFAESLPSPAIVIMQKIGDDVASEHKIKVDIKTDSDLPDKLKKEIKKMEKITALEKALDYLLNNLNFYEVTQKRFEYDDELLFTVSLPDKIMPLIEKIEIGCKTLGEICNGTITEGDTKRKEEKYVIKIENYEKLPENEKLVYKKVLKGVNIKRYIVEWGGFYIKSLSESPSQPRLLIKDYSKRLTVACEVDERFRCLRTVYCAYPKEPSLDSRYLLAILNSTLMHFYYLMHFYTSRPGKGSFRFRTQFLKRLPIKYTESQLLKQIIECVGRIISIKKELLKLGHKIAHFPHSYLRNEWSFEKLINKVKSQNLSKSSYKIPESALKAHYFRDLSGKETFRINLARNEYIDFSSEEVATYVYEVLKKVKRLTKHELLELKIPQKPQLKNVLNEYRMDKEQIAKNRKVIEELEKQIDNLVYKLYNVTYAERRIIENYLKKYGD